MRDQGKISRCRAGLVGGMPRRSPNDISRWPWFVAGSFLAVLGLATQTGKIPPILFAIYLAGSLLTFVVYAWDKAAARRNAWRTRESTLHLLALIGGWPGALVAQNSLRHKSRKNSFLAVFWGSTLVNCTILTLIISPTGSTLLKKLFRSP